MLTAVCVSVKQHDLYKLYAFFWYSNAWFLDLSPPCRKFHKLNLEDPDLVFSEVDVVATLMITA